MKLLVLYSLFSMNKKTAFMWDSLELIPIKRQEETSDLKLSSRIFRYLPFIGSTRILDNVMRNRTFGIYCATLVPCTAQTREATGLPFGVQTNLSAGHSGKVVGARLMVNTEKSPDSRLSDNHFQIVRSDVIRSVSKMSKIALQKKQREIDYWAPFNT